MATKVDEGKQANRTPQQLRERWQSPAGLKNRNIVLGYFRSMQGNTGVKFDFSSLQATFTFAPIDGKFDLAGMNLSELLEFRNCEFSNVSFECAVFTGMSLTNVSFTDVILDNADLRNTTIAFLHLDGKTTMNSADIRNAEISFWNGLTDKVLWTPIKFNRPWYPYMFYKTVTLGRDFRHRYHTLATNIDPKKLDEPWNREFREYLNWYQHVTRRFENISDLGFPKAVSFLAAMLFTQYWSSFIVLFSWAALFNGFMAWVISSHTDLFHYGTTLNFGDALYYSLVTFTTLGYGDIYPKTGGGEFIAGTIVTIGYITLGVLIYLLSRKVERIY